MSDRHQQLIKVKVDRLNHYLKEKVLSRYWVVSANTHCGVLFLHKRDESWVSSLVGTIGQENDSFEDLKLSMEKMINERSPSTAN